MKKYFIKCHLCHLFCRKEHNKCSFYQFKHNNQVICLYGMGYSIYKWIARLAILLAPPTCLALLWSNIAKVLQNVDILQLVAYLVIWFIIILLSIVCILMGALVIIASHADFKEQGGHLWKEEHRK